MKYELLSATTDKVNRLFDLVMEGIGDTIGQFGYLIGAYGDDPNAPDSVWELQVFEDLTELVGGADDGCQVFSGFTFDATAVLAALTPDEEVGPSVSFDASVQGEGTPAVELSGRFEGQAVNLSVCGRPPGGAEVVQRERRTKDGIVLEPVDDEEEDE